MATLRGIIERITYQNEDTGFTVFRLQPESSTLPVVCVGLAPTVEPGVSVVLAGEHQRHKRYGTQFAVASYEIVRPTTVEGIRRLLSSGFITTIGGVRAERIVAKFGTETLDILDTSPDRLLEVSGIGKKILGRITAAWERQKHLRELVLFLQQFGVTLNLAYKIYRAYGANAQARVSANPYALVEDIWGVGFRRADSIAQKLGFAHDSYKRINAGIVHVLQEAAGEGHTYLPEGELLTRTAHLLEIEEALSVYSLDHAAGASIVVRDEGRVYLPVYYHAEARVAAILGQRIASNKSTADTDDNVQLEARFRRRALEAGWQPDPGQLAACTAAAGSSLFVLTGGPGTGKTTTLQLIVSHFHEQGIRVALAAPTGRAAQRMGTVAGHQAQTIHRLLEFRPRGDGYGFTRNASNPLEADVVVLDEVSMVDILLLRALLEAVPKDARIIFVGDSNQLPSVGPGNALADLIASRRIPHAQLNTLFRQAAQSKIVTCAHRIIDGHVPNFANASDENCFFLSEEEPEDCIETVVGLVCTRLPRRYGFDPRGDVQVLSPMHRGPLGTVNLNQILQKRLTKGGVSVTRGDTTFTTGDRVMQLRNNYDLGVFNGDIGYIRHISEDEGVWVDFGGTRVCYEFRSLDEISLAYCISIHKSQGCEFRAVVIPLVTQHYVMLKRNLVYTALTRARELCIFVGSPKALGIAVRNNEALHRYSGLCGRIAG